MHSDPEHACLNGRLLRAVTASSSRWQQLAAMRLYDSLLRKHLRHQRHHHAGVFCAFRHGLYLMRRAAMARLRAT